MIVITGGGTGGHLAIADAVKRSFNKDGIKPIFIGSLRGQDKAWFEDDDGFSKTYFLPSQGVMNKNIFGKVLSLFQITLLAFKVIKIYRENSVEGVLSVGGYSAAPASFAAILLRKKLYIHEQNSVIGSLNKILKPFASKLFSAFGEYDYCDYPVKDIFFEKSRVRSELSTVIFLGGSQGAKAINNLALDLIPYFKKRNIRVIHQCGKNDFERVESEYKKRSFKADLFAFSQEIPSKIEEADFAIARSGAGTLFELTASQIPALFIPYPYAAKNHQLYNARSLAKKGLCYILEERELESGKIEEILEREIEEISTKLEGEINSGGSDYIANEIRKDIYQYRN